MFCFYIQIRHVYCGLFILCTQGAAAVQQRQQGTYSVHLLLNFLWLDSWRVKTVVTWSQKLQHVSALQSKHS